MKRANYLYLFLLLILSCTAFVLIRNCGRSGIVINNILLDIPESFNKLSSDDGKEVLREEIQKIISRHNNYKYNPERASGQMLKIILSMAHGEERKKSILMTAILMKPDDDIQRRYKAWSEISLQNGELVREDFLSSVKLILDSLYRLRMRGAVNNDSQIEKIEKKLRGEKVSESEMLNAIAILQEAKDKRSIETMVRLLEHTEDLLIGNALIMALGDMGDEEALPAILEFAERKPSVIRRQAIIAARHIGSKLAAEWLLVMAYGHDDPIVREEAKAALLEVENNLGLLND